MTDHTPTAKSVRQAYIMGDGLCNQGIPDWNPGRDFDRWLSTHNRKIAAEALREAAEDWERLVQRERPPVRGSLWLSARADRIEQGGES